MAASQRLQKCPMCLRPLDGHEHLGLRDFKWLGDALPGRVGLADIDGVLEQSATGRVLMLELKPLGARLDMGQRLLLRRMVRAGFDVWVVWGDGPVKVGALNREGQVPFMADLTLEELRLRVRDWWREGFDQQRVA